MKTRVAFTTDELRARAEARVAAAKSAALGVGAASEADARRLVHELEVHQVELQLQNEELRVSRAAAEMARERYIELFEFAPVAYVTLGPDGVIHELNHLAAQLLEQPRARLAGQSFSLLVRASDRPKLASLVRDAWANNAKASGDFVLMTSASHGFTAHVSARALQRGDRSLLLAFEDISERKAKADALERAEADLRETDRRKNEFLAMLSHELRNPLAPIRNSLFVMSHEEAGVEAINGARLIIDRQVGLLARLVDDLLDMTRITRGMVNLRRDPVEARALVLRTIDDHRGEFEQDQLSLEVRGDPGPCWVDGDAARIIQALSNVLGNAKKFTPAGGRIVVELARDASQFLVTVRDSGAGVAPEEVARVFQPFSQAPQSIDRSRGGLGLGLAMVKGFIELHGGTVALRSEGLGRGTEVSIALPIIEPPVTRGATAPTPGIRARRVLVVEDNVDSADTLQLALSLNGHQVAVAYSGATALEVALEFGPTVVVCDLGLPGMDGYEVARTLRANPAFDGLYLIALSGYVQPEDRRRAAAAGFDEHMAKPPSLDALERLIAAAP